MSHKNKIIPTITEKTLNDCQKRIALIQPYFKRAQYDLVCRDFTDNQTFSDISFLNRIKNDLNYDFHIMSKTPEKFILDGIKSPKVDRIIFHFEIDSNIERLIKLIKDSGKIVGLGINPETSIKEVEYLLPDLDLVLIMCVNPGFYGSEFLPKTMNKIKKLRKIAPEITITADGGIKNHNVSEIKKAGADEFCVGSFLNDEGIEKRKEELEKALENS